MAAWAQASRLLPLMGLTKGANARSAELFLHQFNQTRKMGEQLLHAMRFIFFLRRNNVQHRLKILPRQEVEALSRSFITLKGSQRPQVIQRDEERGHVTSVQCMNVSSSSHATILYPLCDPCPLGSRHAELQGPEFVTYAGLTISKPQADFEHYWTKVVGGLVW